MATAAYTDGLMKPTTTTSGTGTAGVYTGPMTMPGTPAPTAPTITDTPKTATTATPTPQQKPLVNPASTTPTGAMVTTGQPTPPNVPVPAPAPAPVPGNTGIVGPAQGGGSIVPGSATDLRYQTVMPGASPLTGQANSAVGNAMQQLTSGPDRAALAQQMFDTFANGSQGAYDHAQTDATRRAAANGTLHSGMLTNEYGDLANQRETQLDTVKQGFMQNALSGTIQDRLNNLGALGGIQGQLSGQDAAQRGEVRDERGYQQGIDQQALQNAIQQILMGDQLQNSATQRQTNWASLLGQFGFGGDPTSALLGGRRAVRRAGGGESGRADEGARGPRLRERLTWASISPICCGAPSGVSWRTRAGSVRAAPTRRRPPRTRRTASARSEWTRWRWR
jgi:hypothetical protein